MYQTPLVLLICLSAVQADCASSNSSTYRLPDAGPISEFPPPAKHLLSTIAGLQTWAQLLSSFETPISVRFTHLIDVLNWNCAAVYSSSWKDALTKTDPIFRMPAEVLIDGDTISLHVSDTRLLCMASSWATVVQDWIPDGTGVMMEHFEAFMYPNIELGYNAAVDSCFDLMDGSANTTCLYEVAEDSCFSPSVIGSIVGRQVNEHAKRDGWNMYGVLDSDGTECKANCRRYADPTGIAKNEMNVFKTDAAGKRRLGTKKGKKSKKSKNEEHIADPVEKRRSTQWKPMLEDDGRGYFVRQEHVTPYIGQLGKRWLLSDEEFYARSLQDPEYDYDLESHLVIQRLSNLTDLDKMEIEFFDDKLSVAFGIVEAVVMKGATFEQVLNFVVGITAVEYESILLSWKEKVRHNLIRPTTWIQENLAYETFTTWAGPYGGGSETIEGKNVEAYVRVMPHSEYISASACLCQGIYEFTDSWLVSNFGITDSVSVNVNYPKFSSKTEPGAVPSDDVKISFAHMLAVRDACGESRLKGGMHFTKSVTDAYDLCEGVGYVGHDFAVELWG